MKEWKSLAVFVFTLLLLGIFSAFSYAYLLSDSEAKEYFPTKTGTRWEYEIVEGEDYGDKPVYAHTILWRREDGSLNKFPKRGEFSQFSKYSTPYELVLSVIGPAYLDWYDSSYPRRDSVELKVEKDELGIFKDCVEVYWTWKNAIRDDLAVEMVTTYEPTAIGSIDILDDYYHSLLRSYYNPKKPYARRIFFFNNDPQNAMWYGDEDEADEELLFVGSDGPELYFVRRVKKSKEDKTSYEYSPYWGYLPKAQYAFEELMWFAKGKGLVRLVQVKRGDKTMKTMIWKLVNFTEGK